MGTGGLSSRSFAIQNWSTSNRRSHRRTRWASGASCLQSKASTTLSLACAPTAPNSSARWPSTRTCTDSATCEALRASSSRWPRNSNARPNTRPLFATKGEEENLAEILKLPDEEQDLVGIVLYGENKQVDKAVDGLKLHPQFSSMSNQ